MSAVYTPTRYKLTIEDYHKLGEVGILNENSRVELIEGELIHMAPIGIAHVWAVTRLNHLLVQAVGDRAFVSPAGSVAMPPISEPQPDFALLRPPARDSKPKAPHPEDVLLIVEVSDTTLRYDRGTKLRLYARSGIREFWIVDVNARTVECYRDPQGDAFRDEFVVGMDGQVSIAALPDTHIAVSDIFQGA